MHAETPKPNEPLEPLEPTEAISADADNLLETTPHIDEGSTDTSNADFEPQTHEAPRQPATEAAQPRSRFKKWIAGAALTGVLAAGAGLVVGNRGSELERLPQDPVAEAPAFPQSEAGITPIEEQLSNAYGSQTHIADIRKDGVLKPGQAGNAEQWDILKIVVDTEHGKDVSPNVAYTKPVIVAREGFDATPDGTAMPIDKDTPDGKGLFTNGMRYVGASSEMTNDGRTQPHINMQLVVNPDQLLQRDVSGFDVFTTAEAVDPLDPTKVKQNRHFAGSIVFQSVASPDGSGDRQLKLGFFTPDHAQDVPADTIMTSPR
jgi:hypothetical protein